MKYFSCKRMQKCFERFEQRKIKYFSFCVRKNAKFFKTKYLSNYLLVLQK